MAIRIGTKNIFKVYVGTKEIGNVYVGSKNIFPGIIVPPDPDPPLPTGDLYMVGITNAVLYNVNPSTGVATRVGSATQFGVNESGPTGLAFIPS